MVLLHLLQESKFLIAVAHCNFRLRAEESDTDQHFVAAYCQKNQIPFFVESFETEKFASDNKLSIQLAARKLRYDWFFELKSKHNFDYIVTAHHLDDSLETFLINLSRGTGLEGLLGIQDNQNIIRPLIDFSRRQIEAYAKENNIRWREDLSNVSDKYLRNKIRHHIVPLLKELSPDFLHSYSKTLSHLKESQDFIDESIDKILSEVIVKENNHTYLYISKLKLYKNYKFILYRWLSVYGFTAWEDVYNLLDAQSGKYIESKNYRLLKNRNEFILVKKTKFDADDKFLILEENSEIKIPIQLKITKAKEVLATNNPNAVYVDKNLLNFPLKLRKYKEGEYFYPFGMRGKKKKISKFFKDEKLSVLEKENTWILYSDNHVVWIVGKRLDDRFKITENTTSIIKIEYLK